jgi:hypothetical protein
MEISKLRNVYGVLCMGVGGFLENATYVKFVLLYDMLIQKVVLTGFGRFCWVADDRLIAKPA